MNLTTAQQQILDSLRKDILKHDGHGDDTTYEYKEWTLDEGWGGGVFLVSTVGRKNDEGTMAEVFARTHRHIAIGTRGGVKLLNPGNYDAKQHKMIRICQRSGYSRAIIQTTCY